MFFKQSKKTTDGSTSSDQHGAEEFPFSRYLGEEAAKKLFTYENESSSTVGEVGTISLEDSRKTLGIEEAEPFPRMPPPVPPRIPPVEATEQKMPSIPKIEDIPIQKVPPVETTGERPSMPWPIEEVPIQQETETANLEKQLGELISTFEKMNLEILKRVQDLEDSIKTRSSEIKEEAKTCCDRAIEQARKIKDVMYDAELKDLEMQKRAIEIMDDCEDKAIERARKMKEVFGSATFPK